MNRRALKLLLLVLIGWYLAGPVAETFDHWDDIRAETGDIARGASGVMTFALGGVAVAIALLRRLKARCALLARAFRGGLEPGFSQLALPAVVTAACAFHSPPIPLRI